uniref:Dynein light chain Tctex-type 3 n=1 Tax=Gouania willdenowi TaxID=441366 RepID=A0A8C5GL96_GOUWI
MEDYHSSSNEGTFNSDEADGIIKESIESVVGADDYSQNQVNKWTAGIVERCLTQLVKLGKAYKYMVTCAVMQKTGAGLHTANSCYWDTAMDGECFKTNMHFESVKISKHTELRENLNVLWKRISY